MGEIRIGQIPHINSTGETGSSGLHGETGIGNYTGEIENGNFGETEISGTTHETEQGLPKASP